MKERVGLRYFGYVVGVDPKPRAPNGVLWKVKIQTIGPYFGRKALLDENHIPVGIGVGMDVEFDLVSAGRRGGLVAINAALCVRSEKTEKR